MKTESEIKAYREALNESYKMFINGSEGQKIIYAKIEVLDWALNSYTQLVNGKESSGESKQ